MGGFSSSADGSWTCRACKSCAECGPAVRTRAVCRGSTRAAVLLRPGPLAGPRQWGGGRQVANWQASKKEPPVAPLRGGVSVGWRAAGSSSTTTTTTTNTTAQQQQQQQQQHPGIQDPAAGKPDRQLSQLPAHHDLVLVPACRHAAPLQLERAPACCSDRSPATHKGGHGRTSTSTWWRKARRQPRPGGARRGHGPFWIP